MTTLDERMLDILSWGVDWLMSLGFGAATAAWLTLGGFPIVGVIVAFLLLDALARLVALCRRLLRRRVFVGVDFGEPTVMVRGYWEDGVLHITEVEHE